MAQKQIKKILDDLIKEENAGRRTDKRNDRILALDIPVVTTESGELKVDLNPVVIFDGIETIVGNLLVAIKESCFLGQSDVSVSVNVEREVCPQLYEYGITKVFFYTPVENMEKLPVLYGQIVNHLRYIFNALQSPTIIQDFFAHNDSTTALLFPFNREAANDQTGLHYLIENGIGAHFIRITAEELEHARLNLRRINHRIISNIELVDDYFNIRTEATTVYSAIVGHSFENKRTFKDTGLQLALLISFLNKAGYKKLSEITVNWPLEVASELLVNAGNHWYGSICRMLLMLSDSTTIKFLSDGVTMETEYRGTHIFLTLTQRNRNLQIDLMEKVKIAPIEKYLRAMGRLNSVSKNFQGTLSNIHLVMIHHFTAETLAVLGAFDQMGIAAIDTLWVKYAGSIPHTYMETIFSLPGKHFRFYGLHLLQNQGIRAGLCLSDRFSPINEFSGLQKKFTTGCYEFYDVMQAMGMHLFLNAIVYCRDNNKVVIAEDGGYLAPAVNRLSLEGKTVGEVFQQFGYLNEKVADIELSLPFKEWLESRFAGSVEHTRNGYDALDDVEKRFSKLAFPACSLAVSKFKVYKESLEVAHSCINAIENIMNGQGFVLTNRRCLVLGSLGAIGIQTMKILMNRVGAGKLAGIDIKQAKGECEWLQFISPDELTDETKYNTDLFFGVVGKSILNPDFFDDLTINTFCRDIFLASGSTKRFEFIDFINWSSFLVASVNPSINGMPVKVILNNLEDPQTAALLGSVLQIEFLENLKGKQVNYYMLSNLMPVNFQYYGVPRETMDAVMSEFVSLVKVVATENILPSRLLALDHDINIEGKLL